MHHFYIYIFAGQVQDDGYIMTFFMYLNAEYFFPNPTALLSLDAAGG